jgi:hypothetical protein
MVSQVRRIRLILKLLLVVLKCSSAIMAFKVLEPKNESKEHPCLCIHGALLVSEPSARFSLASDESCVSFMFGGARIICWCVTVVPHDTQNSSQETPMSCTFHLVYSVNRGSNLSTRYHPNLTLRMGVQGLSPSFSAYSCTGQLSCLSKQASDFPICRLIKKSSSTSSLSP